MSLLESLRVAIETLRQNKLRSFLTMVGVIIGVMSVTIIVMISSGFQSYMTGEFKRLGADTIFVFHDDWQGGRRQSVANIDGLTMDDVEYLAERVTSLELVSPMMTIAGHKPVYEDREVGNARIYASNHYFTELNRLAVIEGRHLTEQDVRQRANVCLIGEEVRDRLFPDKQALGKIIQFKGIALEVVGVLERLDIMGETTARDILLPISTAQDKWIGGDTIMMITARPKPGVSVTEAMDRTWEAMMLRSNNKPIYRVDSRESIMQVFGAVLGVAGAILAAIAALSLLVGGIGIMNIMLVSVTERTKEIGLRKAVGAKRGAILAQFLVESGMLSLVGGLIGMSLAWMLGKGVGLLTASMSWPSAGGLATPFPVTAALMAALFSALIGMVFGLYPALSAAKLDPIVALRRE
jgi:putative ABC transport system permease protein